NQQSVVRGFHAFGAEIQFLTIQVDFNNRRSFELALNQRFRQRIFHIFLQSTPDWSRAIQPIGASLLDNPTFCLVSQLDLKPMPAHRLVDLVELQLNNFEQLVVEQLIENDDLVETINELGIESLPN